MYNVTLQCKVIFTYRMYNMRLQSTTQGTGGDVVRIFLVHRLFMEHMYFLLLVHIQC